MSANKVVINASPFILLSKTRILDSLNEIFDRVVMPEGVAAEIGRGNDIASDRLSVVKNEWLSVELATLESEVGIWNLGVGETEVLSYALNHPDHLAVVDDRAARRCAETLRIKCLGTAGLLVLFKRRGLIESVESEIAKLAAAGLYLSDSIKTTILFEAGESTPSK